MTDQNHPITPPPELVQQWAHALEQHTDTEVFNQIAHWGADQELEACCEWLEDLECAKELRASRRPKPPSLKEQALEAMSRFDGEMWCSEMEADLAVIRTALEQLDD